MAHALALLVVLFLAAEEPILRAPSLPASKIIRKVDPVYPPLARERRIHGTVRFQAVIGKDGAVERLRLISGHPLLAPAAREAAKRWIFEPSLLNGRPVRLVTQIVIPFRLGRPPDARRLALRPSRPRSPVEYLEFEPTGQPFSAIRPIA